MMKEKLFQVDGPLFGLLDKLGQLIVLSILWLIGCVPILTIGTSNAALYYAVCKSVRYGQGSAVREFAKCYRMNLVRGCVVTGILTAAGLAVLFVGSMITGALNFSSASTVVMILLLFTAMYIGPALSRFDISADRILKLSFLMSLQYAHYTLLLIIGSGLVGVGILFVMPMACVLILPGVWCLISTFLVERVLQKYMPPKTDDSNWYYDN